MMLSLAVLVLAAGRWIAPLPVLPPGGDAHRPFLHDGTWLHDGTREHHEGRP